MLLHSKRYLRQAPYKAADPANSALTKQLCLEKNIKVPIKKSLCNFQVSERQETGGGKLLKNNQRNNHFRDKKLTRPFKNAVD